MSDEDLPLSIQVEQWRQAAIAGTMTQEQLRAAIQALRAGRTSAVANSSKAKTAATKKQADTVAADILGELDL